jgi:hypothetical protein
MSLSCGGEERQGEARLRYIRQVNCLNAPSILNLIKIDENFT